jgi:thioredoxin 1
MLQLTAETFDNYLADNNLVLVDFYADWCRPCTILAQALNEAEERYTGQAKFVKVDIEVMHDVTQRHNVAAIPTMILFKDGEIASRIVGMRTAEQILAILEEVENG